MASFLDELDPELQRQLQPYVEVANTPRSQLTPEMYGITAEQARRTPAYIPSLVKSQPAAQPQRNQPAGKETFAKFVNFINSPEVQRIHDAMYDGTPGGDFLASLRGLEDRDLDRAYKSDTMAINRINAELNMRKAIKELNAKAPLDQEFSSLSAIYGQDRARELLATKYANKASQSATKVQELKNLASELARVNGRSEPNKDDVEAAAGYLYSRGGGNKLPPEVQALEYGRQFIPEAEFPDVVKNRVSGPRRETQYESFVKNYMLANPGKTRDDADKAYRVTMNKLTPAERTMFGYEVAESTGGMAGQAGKNVAEKAGAGPLGQAVIDVRTYGNDSNYEEAKTIQTTPRTNVEVSYNQKAEDKNVVDMLGEDLKELRNGANNAYSMGLYLDQTITALENGTLDTGGGEAGAALKQLALDLGFATEQTQGDAAAFTRLILDQMANVIDRINVGAISDSERKEFKQSIAHWGRDPKFNEHMLKDLRSMNNAITDVWDYYVNDVIGKGYSPAEQMRMMNAYKKSRFKQLTDEVKNPYADDTQYSVKGRHGLRKLKDGNLFDPETNEVLPRRSGGIR